MIIQSFHLAVMCLAPEASAVAAANDNHVRSLAEERKALVLFDLPRIRLEQPLKPSGTACTTCYR